MFLTLTFKSTQFLCNEEGKQKSSCHLLMEEQQHSKLFKNSSFVDSHLNFVLLFLLLGQSGRRVDIEYVSQNQNVDIGKDLSDHSQLKEKKSETQKGEITFSKSYPRQWLSPGKHPWLLIPGAQQHPPWQQACYTLRIMESGQACVLAPSQEACAPA